MNLHGIKAIYRFEMARWGRTLWQSLVAPVITTSLYFLVFGSAIGSRMSDMAGVDYGSFIVPGLIMLSVLTQAIMNASFGIYFPKFTGTIYEILSAPISPLETVIAYVGAAATKAVILALVTLATATLFVEVRIDHPLLMLLFLAAIAIGFCLLGFAIGIWAQEFRAAAGRAAAGRDAPHLPRRRLLFGCGDRRAMAHRHPPEPDPLPRVGLSLDLLRHRRRAVWTSVAVMAASILLPLAIIVWMFRTGYRLKS